MPIYLDVQGAQSRDSGNRGIGRYVLELAAAIERSAHASAVAGYVTNPDLPVPHALAAALPAGRLLSSADIEFAPGDIFHLTSPFEEVPLNRVWPPSARADGVRLVVTVYDLIPLIFPDHYLPDAAYHARYKNRIELIRLADRAFAISAATARDLVGMINLPEASVVVTGTGVSARFHPPLAGQEPMAAVHALLPTVRPGYVLYAGALDFRKNVDALLIAYSRLSRALRAQHQLVLVSRLSERELDALRPRLRALDIARDVVVASSVDDDNLVAVYQAARLFVFPSLYEGFGLPVAEAIACGTPTIASNVSSLVEILTDPATLFDPSDPESLRDTMERALTDPAAASLPPAQLDARHTWPAVVERMIAACAELEQLPVTGDGRRTAAIAALVAGEDAPWIEAAGPHVAQSPARSAARALLWPLRRFFDPRFAGVDTHVTTMHADISARMDRAFGPWGSQSLVDVERSIQRLSELVAAQSDGSEAAGGARTLGLAHALVALGSLPAGSRVLDASSPPTGLAGSLTALGYEVAVMASLPVSAPPFDAVVAIGASDGTRDLARFARPGGKLVVSVESHGGDPRASLAGMLGATADVEVRLLRCVRNDAWEPVAAPDGATGELVALATARRETARGDTAYPDVAARRAGVGVTPASDA